MLVKLIMSSDSGEQRDVLEGREHFVFEALLRRDRRAARERPERRL